ncbi:hypothetical protein L1887_43256 [Cichorium endivia]|nr:hypothetical protein L1887_43256 [Cichorium endivia]
MKNSVANHGVLVLALTMMLAVNGVKHGNQEIGVGVILDMDSSLGKSIRVSMLMAIEDFYGDTNNSSTVIIPHFRDSKSDNVDAASAAIDLLKNIQVTAILGPQQSSQAHFLLDIAQRSKVPIISPATNPDLSPIRNPYFIRIAHASSTQAQPIAALIKSFDWKEVVFVYEDTDFGREPIPYLSDAMVNIGTQVKYRTLLSPSTSDDRILLELYKLKSMQTQVFVVHMLPPLAARFFRKVDEAGMMAQGYVWIITDVLTGLLHHLDHLAIQSMQGVLGVKPYIPQTNPLTNFERRWRRRFHKDYPDIDELELDMFGIWSYDFVVGLAMALKRVENEFSSTTFKRPTKASTDLDAIGTSEMGSRLLPMIRNIAHKGMSGDFQVVNGQLQTSAYQIVNVIGKGEKQVGFWSSINGISSRVSHNQSSGNKTKKVNLGAIIWPGDTPEYPKGSETRTGGDIFLRVGVPADGGFVEFIGADIDPNTKEVKASGFVIDVFKAVIDTLPYTVHYNITPYEAPDGKRIGDYDDLLYQLVLGEKMVCNLSRFVVIVWLVVVLVLTSSYTASFASMLTVQKLRPTITDIFELRARGEYIGYQDGSYIGHMLKDMGYPNDKLKEYLSFQEYADALSNGSRNNGVAAIVDDVPYLKMLMAKNCNKYLMVGPVYKSAGFGFAFPKQSPLVDDFSKGILKVIEGRMSAISNKWFGDRAHCPEENGAVQPFDKLTVASFKGLFLISGLSSTYALIVSVFNFLYENKAILISRGSFNQKLAAIIQSFDEKKERKPSEAATVHPLPSPAISPGHQLEGVWSPRIQI